MRIGTSVRSVVALGVVLVPALVAASSSGPAYATFAGKNGVVAFSTDERGEFDIWTVSADGTTFHALTKGPATDNDPSYSPDGKRIVFIRNDDVWLMHADGSRLHSVLLHGKYLYMDPSFSPNGKRLLWNDSNGGIFTSLTDGTRKRRIGGGAAGYGAKWSPDGKRIAYASPPSGSSQIWLVRPDGTHNHALTSAVANQFDADVDWSPGGKRIVFDRKFNTGTYDLMIASVNDAVDARGLLAGLADVPKPVFSPDGARIAYQYVPSGGGTQHIQEYFLATEQTAELGGLTGGEASPGWQPRP